MIRVIITGAAGRMGKMNVQAVLQDSELKLTGAVEIPHSPYINQDAGTIAGIGNIGVLIKTNLLDIIEDGDVVIDFTTPESTITNLEITSMHRKAMVIGTTGISDLGIKKIKEASENIPIVFSPNMSVGVNLLFKLAGEVAKTLHSGYDIEIIEAHHKHKKDAPSGTAKKIFEIIAKQLHRDLEKDGVYGRRGITGERKETEIGIHAIRGGDIVGEHTVLFAGSGECFELKHSATSRMTFAKGAVLAAKFIAKKKKGLFSMADVLQL